MKRRNLKKKLATVMIPAVLCSAFAMSGCDKKTEEVSSEIIYPKDGIYPVSCDDTLTIWKGLNGTLSTMVTNFADSELSKELEKRTGIKVEYLHPATGMASEQFNLLIASDDMPDIISTNWHNYGAQQAIDEGTLISINDVIDKWAPNYKKVLEENADLAPMMRTAEGNYYGFCMIRGDETLCSYTGPIIRKDWLDELGLPIPETLEDWENMLTAFKEKKKVQAPLSIVGSAPFGAGMITGAFGITDGFYLDGDVVKHGALEAEYRDFVELMRKWCEKGLIDENIAGMDRKILTNQMLNGKTGATFLEAGGGIGTWLDAKRGIGDNSYALVGVPYPVMNKGDSVEFAQYDWRYSIGHTHAITTSCNNVELAARFLDYAYSEEGYRLMNFGIEGITYDMVDGEPKFSKFTTDNPDGLTMDQVLVQYAMSSYGGALVQDKAAIDATRKYQEQNDALAIWSKSNVKAHKLPIMTMSEDDTAELSKIVTDVDTYKNEMLYGFILGTESLDNYDTFIKRIKQIGIERAIEIYQNAYDNYKKQ